MITMGGPVIGLREKLAVVRQLSSGRLAQGPAVHEFEEEFCKRLAQPFGVAMNSGTSALHLGLLALGVGPGDEIIVPSFSFAATANAVALTGATPVFCDVEEDFFTLDARLVRQLITPRTKGLIPVHLYGQMADMCELNSIAQENGLFVFEDAAQAHGATLDSIPAGAWGDLSAFSFYPTKNMTTGEGGMLVTSSKNVFEKARLLRNQGMERRYENIMVGFNNRMTEISASIGLVQLRRLDGLNKKRVNNARLLSDLLGGVPGLSVPKIRAGATHVFHQYTLRIRHGRDTVQKELRKCGIESAVYYPKPIHKLDSFANPGTTLPVTETLSRELLSIPVHPKLRRSELVKIAGTIRESLT